MSGQHLRSCLSFVLPGLAGAKRPSTDFTQQAALAEDKHNEPLYMPNSLNGKELLAMFAVPFRIGAQETLDHLENNWARFGDLDAPDMVGRHIESVTGARVDEKLKRAIEANFREDSLTGTMSNSTNKIVQGLDYKKSQRDGRPFTCIEGDASNLGGFNEYAKNLYVTAGLQEPGPATPDSPSWKFVDAVMRITYSEAMRACQSAISTLGEKPERNKISAGRASEGDESSIGLTGILKSQSDTVFDTHFYIAAERVVNSFGLGNIPRVGKPPYILAKRGTGVALGSFDPNAEHGLFFRNKDEREKILAACGLSRKVRGLVVGTIRQYYFGMPNEAMTQRIDKEFGETMDSYSSPETLKATGMTKATIKAVASKLVNGMFLSHSYGERPVNAWRSLQTKRTYKQLIDTMKDAAALMKPQYRSWSGRYFTEHPTEPTPDGIELVALDKKTALELITRREGLYKSPDGPFYDAYNSPFYKGPQHEDPFDVESNQIGEPSWIARKQAIFNYGQTTQPKVGAESWRMIAECVAAPAATDPASGLLAPDAQKKELVRHARDNIRILDKFAQASDRDDPLLQQSFALAEGNAGKLSSNILVLQALGVVGKINDEYAYADADRFIRFAADQLVKVGHKHGFHIPQVGGSVDMDSGNVQACHYGKTGMLLTLPFVVEEDGEMKLVDKKRIRAFARDYAQSFEPLLDRSVAEHLQELGGLARPGNTKTYRQLGMRLPDFYIVPAATELEATQRNLGGEIMDMALSKASKSWGGTAPGTKAFTPD